VKGRIQTDQLACELHSIAVVLQVGKLNAMGEVIAHNGERFTLDTAGSKSLSAQARAAVVLQLAGVTSQAAAQLGSSLAAAASGNPSVMAMPMLGGGGAGAKAPTPCLLLKNLFDPTKETQKDWDVRVKEAVLAECSKFGIVVHIYVVRDSMVCNPFPFLVYGVTRRLLITPHVCRAM
jgi:hypothetical protein